MKISEYDFFNGKVWSLIFAAWKEIYIFFKKKGANVAILNLVLDDVMREHSFFSVMMLSTNVKFIIVILNYFTPLVHIIGTHHLLCTVS